MRLHVLTVTGPTTEIYGPLLARSWDPVSPTIVAYRPVRLVCKSLCGIRIPPTAGTGTDRGEPEKSHSICRLGTALWKYSISLPTSPPRNSATGNLPPRPIHNHPNPPLEEPATLTLRRSNARVACSSERRTSNSNYAIKLLAGNE